MEITRIDGPVKWLILYICKRKQYLMKIKGITQIHNEDTIDMLRRICPLRPGLEHKTMLINVLI